MKQKVLAYIFRNNEGIREILVFDHVKYPEVSPQVIGGTIDGSEWPEEAVIREVFEESGLKLSIHVKLGEFKYHREDINEEQLKHVFSFEFPMAKEKWTHSVSSGEEDKGLEFRFYWMQTNEAKIKLLGNMGDYLGL